MQQDVQVVCRLQLCRKKEYKRELHIKRIEKQCVSMSGKSDTNEDEGAAAADVSPEEVETHGPVTEDGLFPTDKDPDKMERKDLVAEVKINSTLTLLLPFRSFDILSLGKSLIAGVLNNVETIRFRGHE